MDSLNEIENAISTIRKPADGSKANSKAHERAAKILKTRAAHLLDFAMHNEKSTVYVPCIEEVTRLVSIAEFA